MYPTRLFYQTLPLRTSFHRHRFLLIDIATVALFTAFGLAVTGSVAGGCMVGFVLSALCGVWK